MTPVRYGLNLLKLLDVALNVALLFSERVETLSRRAARARNGGKRWGCILCRVLDAVVSNHCDDALAAGEIE